MELEPTPTANERLVEIVADIVSAFLSYNSMPAADVPELIGTIYATVAKLAAGQEHTTEATQTKQEPAVPIKKSITKDYIICLEDGKKFKSMKRHLASAYGMTPDEYRAKWNLPPDYPMVAAGYSAARSRLAKEAGLGTLRTAAKAVATPTVKEKPRGRGRQQAA